MNTRTQILQLLTEKGELSVHQLTEALGISRQRIHQILREMAEEKQVKKLGTSPRVYYQVLSPQSTKKVVLISDEERNFLAEHFLLVDPMGQLSEGLEGFTQWCHDRKLPVEKTIKEYIHTMGKYLALFDANGLIDGIQKLNNTKEISNCMEAVYYADFYAIERFGKTKLGALLHHAKVSQSKRLIRQIVEKTSGKLHRLIHKFKIDAVGYIPPTLKRDVQIMNELKKGYKLSLPHISIQKIFLREPVPQKSLKRIEDRILNARNTIVVNELSSFKTVLLIDDALGSGATMTETACKLIAKKVATRVIGFAITGSYKGFEVIAEV